MRLRLSGLIVALLLGGGCTGSSDVNPTPTTGGGRSLTGQLLARRDAVGSASQVAALARADFDGDGLEDLAVPGFGNSRLDLYRNRGDGSFEAARTLDFENAGLWGVAAADLDADGDADLALSESTSQQVSVLLNDGRGDFGAPQRTAADGFPTGLAAADFTGDGVPDLAVTLSAAERVDVFPNQGDGRLGPPVPVPIGSGPRSLAAADFDGDGLADLAVARPNDGLLTVRRNDGQGGFLPAQDLAVGAGANSPVAADWTGDGRPDLAVAAPDQNALAVALNRGDGTFAAPRATALPVRCEALAVADFDRDGRLDLAASAKAAVQVLVLLGDGQGDFGAPRAARTVAAPAVLDAADFDRDGQPDVVAAADEGGVGLLLNRGGGALAAAVASAVDFAPAPLAAADFDRDGRADLALAGGARTREVALVFGSGEGRFAARGGPQLLRGHAARLEAADLDRDGFPDVVAADQGAGLVSILMNRAGTLQTPASYGVDGVVHDAVAVDLTGDGAPDVAATSNDLSGGGVATLINAGDGRMGVGTLTEFAGAVRALAAGDFDGDGRQDLAAAAGGDLGVMLNRGGGQFEVIPDVQVGTNLVSLGSADLDGDGDLDLLAADQADPPCAATLRNDGAGHFQPWNTLPVPRLPRRVRCGDLDRNGTVDVFTVLQSHVAVALGRGDGTFGPWTLYGAEGDCFDVALGDFDGDTIPDLATALFATPGSVRALLQRP